MYSTERANQIPDNVEVKYLEAGIHEDVKLANVRVDESVNGNMFIEIKFEKDGKSMSHTEWEANKRDDQSDEEFQAKNDRQVKRLLQILKCFHPLEILAFTGSSFKEFANWVAKLLNIADKTKKLRLKVVYNTKGYTTLPNYAKFPFIEPMILPEGESSKVTKLGIDLFERPIVADVEAKDTNPLASTTTSTTVSDLPF